MADDRDWLSTLWRASYKGFPFQFESDEEEGGLNPVIHKFPHRDDPYIEQLGEEPRLFSGTAYVHGNDADAQAGAFSEVLASKGAGFLVIPQRGPVLVQALPFKRRNDKDKLGLVAYEVKFVRDGAKSALISLGSLTNAAFGAADTLAAAITSTFAATAAVDNVPAYVSAPVYDTIATAASALDALRSSVPVVPASSATLRDALANLVADASDETASVDDMAARLIGAARDLADALPAEIAAAAMSEFADAFPSLVTPSSASAQNAAAAERLVRLAGLTAYAEAIVRRDYPARPDGVRARDALVARFDAELEQSGGAENATLNLAIQDLRGAVVEYLMRLITTLAPVITVTAQRQMPSLVWAWKLYADPARAAELVARNRVRHPSFMPETFEALAR